MCFERGGAWGREAEVGTRVGGPARGSMSGSSVRPSRRGRTGRGSMSGSTVTDRSGATRATGKLGPISGPSGRLEVGDGPSAGRGRPLASRWGRPRGEIEGRGRPEEARPSRAILGPSANWVVRPSGGVVEAARGDVARPGPIVNGDGKTDGRWAGPGPFDDPGSRPPRVNGPDFKRACGRSGPSSP